MTTAKCRSALKPIQDDFEKLSLFITEVQRDISVWQAQKQLDNTLLEFLPELLTPLENLSLLTLALFRSTSRELKDYQIHTFNEWRLALASAYCVIQEFIQDIDDSLMVKKVATNFYSYAAFELRPPLTILRGYFQLLDEQGDFLVAPFSEYQDSLAEIDYWIEQFRLVLGNFIEQIKKQ